MKALVAIFIFSRKCKLYLNWGWLKLWISFKCFPYNHKAKQTPPLTLLKMYWAQWLVPKSGMNGFNLRPSCIQLAPSDIMAAQQLICGVWIALYTSKSMLLFISINTSSWLTKRSPWERIILSFRVVTIS